MPTNPQVIVVATSALSAIIGFGLAIAVAPVPEVKNECNVYKVAPKSVTSFVLKPPPATPAVCPAVPKCEAQELKNQSEVVNEPETVKQEPKPRKRHRRIRRYWR